MEKQIKTSMSPSLPALSDDGSLANYIQQIQRFPILSAEEEYEYATNWAKDHDKLSAEKLISSHLRLVVSMAYKLKNYGIPVSELIASGNLGLMQALQKFEPERGFRFSTYATFWIRAEMYDMILNNWSMVKIGSSGSRKKIFFNLARTKRALGIMNSNLSGEDIKQIASNLDVSELEVENMSTRIHARDRSLNVAKYDDGGGEMLDFLEDSQKSIHETLEEHELQIREKELLQKYLSELSGRDREIITARKVRQIEERAYNKLRKAILDEKNESIDQ